MNNILSEKEYQKYILKNLLPAATKSSRQTTTTGFLPLAARN